jgi:chorismate mutase-like protein
MSEQFLAELRKEIDAVDEEIVTLLAKRMVIVHRVSDVKLEHGIPSYLPERIAAVLEKRAAQGETMGLDGDFVRSLYRVIIDEACRLEDEVLGTPKAS